MSDSPESQPDSTTQAAPVETKDAPAATGVPADTSTATGQQPAPAEEPQEQQSGWASWFQRVRKSAEEAVAICKHDLLEMTTQIREDTTEAVESLFLITQDLFICSSSPFLPLCSQRWTRRPTWRTSPRRSTTSSAPWPRPLRRCPRCLRASSPPRLLPLTMMPTLSSLLLFSFLPPLL